jgi:S-phase kinase-associated protein 1
MSKLVKLLSSDGHIYEVDEVVASHSLMLRNMFEDTGITEVIPLLNISGRILAKVIEFCKCRVEGMSEDLILQFDKDFVDVDKDTLFNIIAAADYLCMEDLMDLTCKAAAHLIKGMSLNSIRKIFNIENDLTPEEEEEYRSESASIFG